MRWSTIAVALLACSSTLPAQTYAPHLLVAGPQFVAGLMQASDGNFYAVTADSIVRVTPSGAVTTLYQITGAGNTLDTGLVQWQDGWLYGATESYVFKISLSGEFQKLSALPASGALSAFVPASDGNLYLALEGDDYSGNLYRYNPRNNELSTVGPTAATVGVLQGADGYLYVTLNGDPQYPVYRIQTDGTGYEGFSTTATGTGPESGITEGPDGVAYGVTTYGGVEGGYGDLFKVSADGTSTSLFDLQGGYSEPSTALYLASDGTYFGFGSGFRSGVEPRVPAAMFRFNPAANTLKTVVTNPFINGSAPNFGPLIGGSDGKLYGTVTISPSEGAVYTIAPNPPLPPAVQVSAPATIATGQSITATFRVLNAFSLSAQQCNAFIRPTAQAMVALGPVSGALQGKVYTGSFQATASAPGDYVLALNCGGVESGFAAIEVEAAN